MKSDLSTFPSHFAQVKSSDIIVITTGFAFIILLISIEKILGGINKPFKRL